MEEILLFTRKEIVRAKPGIDSPDKEKPHVFNLVFPEDLIARVCCSFWLTRQMTAKLIPSLQLVEKLTTENEASDDVFGEFPFLLYKQFFITRENIISFLKQVT